MSLLKLKSGFKSDGGCGFHEHDNNMLSILYTAQVSFFMQKEGHHQIIKHIQYQVNVNHVYIKGIMLNNKMTKSTNAA